MTRASRDQAPAREPLWIFCRVVDNFGDAGVSWRLARELAARHGFDVTLIIDDPATLAQIEPGLVDDTRPGGPWQIAGIRIVARRLLDAAADAERAGLPRLPAVIVSAFGCELPEWVRGRLAGGPRQPLWVHLEYLSAEPWVESCHGLVSVKPADAAREHFFYPGFTRATGGLLREARLGARRQVFEDAGGREVWLERLGAGTPRGRRVVSLFCYPAAPVCGWLDLVARGRDRTLVLAAGTAADAAIEAHFGRLPGLGEHARDGELELVRLPMLSQDDYDQLLWSCEVNFVRGEDSWIRAHWAGAPFIWQAYPQPEAAHQAKVEAFLARIQAAQTAPAALAPALSVFRAWNGLDVEPGALLQAWAAFTQSLDSLRRGYSLWAGILAEQPDLADNLARYCRDRI